MQPFLSGFVRVEGDDRQCFAQCKQHFEYGVQLGAGLAGLHPGDDRLFDAAQFLQLFLTDALFLPGLDHLADQRDPQIALGNFFGGKVLLLKFVPTAADGRIVGDRLACSISRAGVFCVFLVKQ